MSEEVVVKKGSWFLRTLGILTVIGVAIAVGRIVMKVLEEEDGKPADDHEGI